MSPNKRHQNKTVQLRRQNQVWEILCCFSHETHVQHILLVSEHMWVVTEDSCDCIAAASGLSDSRNQARETEWATSEHNQGFYSAGWQACSLACRLQPSDFAGDFLAFEVTILKENDKIFVLGPRPHTLVFMY